jgi:alcohol dehydrogenase (cytochrome c)
MVMTPRSKTRLALAATATCVTVVLVGCGGHGADVGWPSSAGNLAGTRAAAGSSVAARNVARLRLRWHVTFPGGSSRAGQTASTPVADTNTAYVQDLRSDVIALDRSNGTMRWIHRFDVTHRGANGLAVDGGRVYGETSTDAFALAASNGRELWRRELTRTRGQRASGAPVAWKGLVFIRTIDDASGRGTIHALDAATGKVRWLYTTRTYPGDVEAQAPVSIDSSGRLYIGSSGLVVLDALTGRLLWQSPVPGLDATPIVADDKADLVVGGSSSGRMIAWNRETRRRLWSVSVDRCAGAAGTVPSPVAYAEGRLFVPIAGSCTTRGLVAVDATTGRTLWQQRFPSADFGCATVSNNAVFTWTRDGTLYAVAARDGKRLWHAQVEPSADACPAVAGNVLLVGVGRRKAGSAQPGLVAFGVR